MLVAEGKRNDVNVAMMVKMVKESTERCVELTLVLVVRW